MGGVLCGCDGRDKISGEGGPVVLVWLEMLTGAQTIAGNAGIPYGFPYVITYNKGTQWPEVSFVFLFIHPLESSQYLPLFGASP